MDERDKGSAPATDSLAHRAFVFIGLAFTVLIGLVLFWYLVDVLLLAFAGVLLAITLRSPADWLSARAHLSPAWSLTLVILAVVALLAGGIWLFGRAVMEQITQLLQALPNTLEALRARLAEYSQVWGWLVEQVQPQRLLEAGPAFLGRGLDVIQTTFGLIANIIIVLFIGLFVAINPALYAGGFLRLVPLPKRKRAREVLAAMGDMLRSWLLARLFLMLVVGTVTTTGLWLLDAPLPLALGLLAGLLDFIPFLGPIFAAIPAILVSLAQSPTLALYVALLYVAIQAVESYVLAPLVEQRAVYLPPALILLAQVILGVLVGGLGVLFATPIAAVTLVAIQMLYVQDLLGDRKTA